MDLADLGKAVGNRNTAGKALYVKKVRGFEAGFVNNILAARDLMFAAIGLEGADRKHFFETYLDRQHRLIPPKIVAKSDIQQKTQEEVNLFAFPNVIFNEKDSNPYITAGIVIGKDPDTGIQNASIHRLEVKGKDRLGIRLEPGSHLLEMQAKAETKGNPLEVAIVIGVHPIELMASVTDAPFGVDELFVAGGLRQEPLEVVRCSTVDLLVPAHGEIVFEGVILPGVREQEGPFGDFMGYYVPPAPNHEIQLRYCSHRPEPIYQAIKAGSREDTYLLGLAREISIYAALSKQGIDVYGVSLQPMVFGGIIALDKEDDETPKKAIKIAFNACPWLKYAVIVDRDVNIDDIADV